MPFKRMTASFSFAFLATCCSIASADPIGLRNPGAWEMDASSAVASIAGPSSGILLPSLDDAVTAVSITPSVTPTHALSAGTRMRELLADFAVTLRNIRYRRGGHEPSTGFDCSGFVRYVFEHSVGAVLPSDSASQFHIGAKVDRADMKTGDLVFFRTRGKRISHVGIYLDHGRFIHSPSTGKTVSINSLSDRYWAKHFAGAKRPKVLS
jgi:cell wall-associated NlpC family hydrolase